MAEFLRKNFGKTNPFVIVGISLLVLVLIFVSFLAPRQTFAWTNLDGGDHGGADWTPSSGDVIAGVHTNIGTFTITSGYTVYVKGVEPSTTANALRRKIYAGKDLHPGRLIENTAQSSLDFSGCQVGYCEDYSVRFTGQILTTSAGSYTFYCVSDDGCRAWVNGVLIFNSWTEHAASEASGAISLSANTWYDIVIDYFQGPGAASFNWDWLPSGGSRANIPSANMRYYNEPPSFSYGSVEIQANVINIAGSLTSSGAGYGGGGGGGGGGCVWGGGVSGPGWFGTSAGSGGGAGSNDGGGWPGICGGAGTGGSSGSAAGSGGGCTGGGSGAGGGAGAYGGTGGAGGAPGVGGDVGSCTPYSGNNGATGGKGGYATVGGQGDSTTDESVNIGSGGAGGGGGGVMGSCGSTRSADCSCSGSSTSNPSGGGGAGGRGGGSIKLIAYTGTASLTISGSVTSAGTTDGGNALSATCNSPSYNNAIGGLGFAVGSGSGSSGVSSSGAGGSGGGGAGGGVLLKGKTVSVTGSVNALGGGSSTTNGGTVKIFYESGSWAGISAGRTYTQQLAPTGAPSNFAGSSVNETTIRWTWSDITSETNYYVYNASNNATISPALAQNTTSWDETGLSAGTSYSRYVKGCNAFGCSPASNTGVSSPVLNAPSNFSGASVSGQPTAIDWSWTDNSSQETAYRIYECGTDTLKVTAAANATTVRESGLTPGTQYCRYAKAYKASPQSESAASNTANATSGTGYVSSGELTSAIYDTQILGGAALNAIMWQGVLPSGTAVKFQVASGNATSGPWTYIGLDGTSNSYYQPSGPGVPVQIERKFHTGQRYFRYKVFLSPDASFANTPTITDIILNWSP